MQVQPIDYAPDFPIRKRRRAIRRAIFVIAAVVITVLAIKSAPSAWRHTQILYWQHRAMTYTAPASQLVYDDDPSTAPKLRSSAPSTTVGGNGEVFSFAKPWDRLYQLISPPGLNPTATCFLHERTNPKGNQYLVMVELRPFATLITNSQKYLLWDFDYVLVRQGGLTRLPEAIIQERWTSIYPSNDQTGARARHTRWYAGQPDTSDPCHFTIRGVADGQPVQVDGWLRDDHVELSNAAPFTSPAPSSAAKSPPSGQ